MARQYEGHTRTHEAEVNHKQTHKKKAKKQKVMTAGVFSLSLLFGIIFFAICFVVGMTIGPNLPM